jgi:protein ImuB
MMQRRLLSLWLPNRPNFRDSAAPADPLSDLALWCQQYSPLTAIDPPDGVVIDITGCAHLFGGEVLLRRHIETRVPDARSAIADTAAAAWGLARYGQPGSEDLGPLPLAALRLDPVTLRKLRRVGIRRIDELQRLPRAELTAGFGAEPVYRLALAFGQAPEAQKFISPPPDWREIEHHAEPIFAPLQLQAALTRLCPKLCKRLTDAGRGVTQLVARFYRVDSQCPEFLIRFAAPSHDELHIGRLLIEKLNGIDPGFGVEAVSLTAITTESCPPLQRSTETPAPDYAQAIDTLLNRLGPKNFWRVSPHASHIPERQTRRLPVTQKPAGSPPGGFPPGGWPPPPQPRPVQLLAKPAAITAIAPVPDDPPVTFSWRGKVHRIRSSSGPERIARDWWVNEHDNARPETDHVRDYYALEDSTGARFWIFRAGTHDGIAPPRWYLHGFFG